MLSLAEKDPEFKEQIVNIFAFREMPSKDLLLKIKSQY